MEIKDVCIRWIAIIVISSAVILYLMFNNEMWGRANVERSNLNLPEDTVAVEDFITNENGQAEDYSKAIQSAIDFCATQKREKVKLKANKIYTIKSGLTVKKGVELEFGSNSVIVVKGNYRVLTVEKDAVIRNGTIQVMDPNFQSEVIFLKGQDQYDATNKTRVKNMTIINKSKNYNGTGLSLYAKGKWHNISFVQFENISIVGFKTAIQLKAENPGAGTYSWINANRFENMTIDDCVLGIQIIGSMTIPNECSGNLFTGLQVQLTEKTKQIIKVDGSYNKFEGIVWDAQRIVGSDPLVLFTVKTEYNKLDMNVATKSLSDKGQNNQH
ncbi:hypothetical protein [Sporosarcina sp. D27]|uniref:hypothetical protein n=1 Tax=Sporosarcina sp. D27 TaxID=1382305 RepID=UPI0004AE4EAD|nr:hypothetical protein [Sporosarcina sp. D27]